MGRAMHRLTARSVASATAGYHADGGGLYLLVKPSGSRSWVFRFRVGGRLREMGLGAAHSVPLADARRRAAEARLMRAEDTDPIDARKAARAQPSRTWGEAAEEYIAAQAPAWRGPAQAAQWRQSLKEYGPPSEMPVAAVDTQAVLRALRRIWTDKTETASRVRGRIERIWDAERVAGNVTGENPARWKGHLQHMLPAPAKVAQRSNHAAMPYRDLPGFVRELRAHQTPARLAIEFTLLTAARTSEVTGLQPGEIEGDVWTIPAARMKAGRPHTVPLSRQALAVLARAGGAFPLSENGMLFALKQGMGYRHLTVHGFRSSFRDWVAETTDHAGEVAEMALAHAIRDKTEGAYRRGKLLEKRRELMQAWADYLDGTQPGTAAAHKTATPP